MVTFGMKLNDMGYWVVVTKTGCEFDRNGLWGKAFLLKFLSRRFMSDLQECTFLKKHSKTGKTMGRLRQNNISLRILLIEFETIH